MRLQTPIQYDAIDHKPVDLLFALLVPEASTEEHLNILSRLGTMFSELAIVNSIRTGETTEAVYMILTR